jgi:hypothetical protein
MGLLLYPVFANLFVEVFEKRALKLATHKHNGCFCYVDNTIVTWSHGLEKLESLLIHRNGFNGNRQLTMETAFP